VSALARRAIAELLDAVLALLVVVTAIGSGTWLAIRLLDAGALLITAFSWSAAGHAFAALAGLLAVIDIVLAWRQRVQRGIGIVPPVQREMPWIALVAAIAAVAIALSTQPEIDGWRRLASQPPAPRTNGLPAVGAALIAWCALLLSLPAPMREPAHARDARRRAGAGAGSIASAVLAATARTARAASRALRRLAHAVRSPLRDGRRGLASLLWPPLRVRLGAFLLMLAPIGCTIVPIALTAIEYGGMVLMLIGTATAMFPPVVVVLLALVALMALAIACLLAVPRLWLALLDAHGKAPAWAMHLAAPGTLAGALVAWALRDWSHHWPLAMDLRLAGHPVTPPAVLALDGALLLALHALPRWPAACERVLRVLGYAGLLTLIALAAHRG
jgi:hypothetical protein